MEEWVACGHDVHYDSISIHASVSVYSTNIGIKTRVPNIRKTRVICNIAEKYCKICTILKIVVPWVEGVSLRGF